MTPPRVAEWIVRASIVKRDADAAIGDLYEEFSDRCRRNGSRHARRWYWRQALSSLVPNLRRRIPAHTPSTTVSRRLAMEAIWNDVRYSWRMARRRPGIGATALLSLIVGIAMSATVFSLLNAAVLRPLPVSNPLDLVVLLSQREGGINHNFSYPDFQDYRSAQHALQDLAAYSRVDVSLREDSGSRMIAAELVSPNYFTLLGLPIASGRTFTDADDRFEAAPSAIVTEALWHQLGGGPFASRTVILNGRSFTIVGLVSGRFRGMEIGRDVHVWAPLHMQPILDPSGSESYLPRRTASWLTVFGRTITGISRDRAITELNAAEEAVRAASARQEQRRLTLVPGAQGDSILPEATASPLRLLLGAAILVLVAAAANVASLLLARATDRTREMAVRAALGAGRARLARQVLIETLLLGSIASTGALIAARWCAGLAAPLIAPFGSPAVLDVAIDWRVLVFVAAVGFLVSFLTALAPIAMIVRTTPSGALGTSRASESRSGARIRRGLVIVQFAVSLALVAAATLLVRTVVNLHSTSTGFDIDHVALLEVDPTAAQYDTAQARAYLDRALARLSSLPGVRAAGFARVIPLGFGGMRTSVVVPGYQPEPGEDMEINFNVISPSYFASMGIALREGRAFENADNERASLVAVVNQTMAERFWHGGSAVGRTIKLENNAPPIQIVAVAPDVKYRTLREAAGPSFYVPMAQEAVRKGVFHLRATGDPSTLLDVGRRVLNEVDSAVPILHVRTLRDQADLNLSDERLAMMVGVILGGAALLLSAVGLYAVVSQSVGQRQKELGIRIALGATASDLRHLVLRDGVTLSIVGSAIGLGAALVLSRYIESRLYGVQARDALSYAAAAAILAAVALVAGWLPARRASRVDPVIALRAE
jgi:predicted permease